MLYRLQGMFGYGSVGIMLSSLVFTDCSLSDIANLSFTFVFHLPQILTHILNHKSLRSDRCYDPVRIKPKMASVVFDQSTIGT